MHKQSLHSKSILIQSLDPSGNLHKLTLINFWISLKNAQVFIFFFLCFPSTFHPLFVFLHTLAQTPQSSNLYPLIFFVVKLQAFNIPCVQYADCRRGFSTYKTNWPLTFKILLLIITIYKYSYLPTKALVDVHTILHYYTKHWPWHSWYDLCFSKMSVKLNIYYFYALLQVFRIF